MNPYLQYSLEYAAQRSYLDDLFRVYPITPSGLRTLDGSVWERVEQSFEARDNVALIKSLLDLELFPIKDGYVSYFRRDREALRRNPQTVNRLAGRIYELGLSEVYKSCSAPKETNRQMGACFKDWIKRGALGLFPVGMEEFVASSENAILNAGDAQMKAFAAERLGYAREKGLDLVARFNGKYIIGEAKFLTDFGGHQNAQFEDAISTLRQRNDKVVAVAILDGVLYIRSRDKMYRAITEEYAEQNIMSALVLREFLYQI